MKFFPVLIPIIFSVSLASVPALCGRIDDSREVIQSMDDSGIFRELTGNVWSVRGDPCPGTAPFSLYIWQGIAGDDQYIFLAFDSRGYTYQFSSERWLQIKEPPAAAVPPCITGVWEVPGKSVNAFMLDSNGTVFITDDTGDRTDLFQDFPAAPAQDLALYYSVDRETLYPLILGSDGLIYSWQEEGWAPNGLVTEEAGLTGFELYMNPDTGTMLITGISEDGSVYSNIGSDALTPLDHQICPGEGPWNIDLVPVTSGQFEFLCVDPGGAIHASRSGSWIEAAPGF